MYGWNRQNCEDSARLRQDLEQERWARERAEEQLLATEREQERLRKERQRQRQERCEYDLRQADTWPEALRKQASLCAREAYLDDDADDVGAWFSQNVAACNRAAELWTEEEQRVAPQIVELQKQISVLRDSIRFAVADRLAAEDSTDGGRSVIGALQTIPEDAGELAAWLNW